MKTNHKKTILVTGAHRSGTTWIGQTISASKSVSYIHEPFNINNQYGVFHHKFANWFTYLKDKDQSQIIEAINKTISFDYDYFRTLKNFKSIPFSNPLKITKEFLDYKFHKLIKSRPLLKDPIAIFSAEWLYENFNMAVIVSIRHPAAFAASLKAKNWDHPFNHFINQPELMDDLLFDYADEIIEFSKNKKDIIDQASLLWKLIYSVVYKYQNKFDKQWLFVRHEDISLNPIASFENIFKYLNLPYTKNITGFIEKHSLGNPSSSEKLFINKNIKRNSKMNISKWKNYLTPEEIQRIRRLVHPIDDLFYTDSEW